VTPQFLEEVPDLLSATELRASVDALVQLQVPSGQIPWFPGGHCDPWNHVEAAMALTAAGRVGEARAAFGWLRDTQRADGSWFNYYVGSGVSRRRIDTNVSGYLATGLWHYYLVTGETDVLAEFWPVVERAISFVLRWVRPDGAVAWSLDERGYVEPDALVTGSSSLLHALGCAVAIGERLGLERPAWRTAQRRLGHVLAHHENLFAPKKVFAMDWYYPVLSGALRGEAGRRRLVDGWETFVMAERGVRCVSTNDWVTAAETAECVLALDAVGESERALKLLATTSRHRQQSGGYLTGWVYPQEATFPTDEVASYTVAAVVLAADAVTRSSGGSGIFRDAPTVSPTCVEVDCQLPNRGPGR